LPCTPTMAGVFSVGVNVTDAASGHGSATTLLTVLSPAGNFQVNLSANPSVIDLGQSTNLTATPRGGTGPYTYTYQDLPTGCSSSNESTLPCTPTSAGTFTVEVVVQEANRSEASNTTSFTVVAGQSGLVVTSLVADPATVSVNQSTQLVVTTLGGTAPLSYVFTSLPPGCATADTARLTCVPITAGTYHPVVTVTDADHESGTASTTLNVTSTGPNSPAGTSSSTSWVWYVILIVALLLVLFYFFVARRRRKEAVVSPPAPPPVPPAP
jgi:hypothetical protein